MYARGGAFIRTHAYRSDVACCREQVSGSGEEYRLENELALILEFRPKISSVDRQVPGECLPANLSDSGKAKDSKKAICSLRFSFTLLVVPKLRCFPSSVIEQSSFNGRLCPIFL